MIGNKYKVGETKEEKMTISKTVSSLGRGVELNKPELSVNYIIAATFGVVVLLFAWRIGSLVFSKGSSLVEGRLPEAETLDYKAALGIV